MQEPRRPPLMVAAVLVVWTALAVEPAAAAGETAPGYRALDYPAPAPGTYELPPLGPAPDVEILESDGSRHRLHDLLDDRVVVLSFIYTHCRESEGCPLAGFVLGRLQERLRGDQALAASVRLISLSFDPERDTPEVMRAYGERLRRPPVDWRFLTSAAKLDLTPFGQSVRRDYGADGRYLGTISHILRVILIDRARCIRNIYTASFLHAETLLSDILTVFLAPAGECRAGPQPTHAASVAVEGEPPVRTRSAPLGLPPVPVPAGEPVTPAKVALGRKLFFDRRLSANATISCAICHVPTQGFTSNEMTTGLGIEGRSLRRNAPSLYNVAYAASLFHDGREARLEQQPWKPLLAAQEMGNPSVAAVIGKLESYPDYAGLFEGAFDGHGPTEQTIGAALAAYERTLISANSPFDRWYYAKETEALEPAAPRGFELFSGKAGCVTCHTIGRDHALFTDGAYHDTGIGYRQAQRGNASATGLDVAGGVRLDHSTLAAIPAPVVDDLGRFEVTGDPADRWKYRTPGLRNVALTAPYMHDGSLATLDAVVEHYDRGGVAHELLDPAVRSLGLTPREVDDLVAFLRSLTGDNVAVLTAEASSEPVGESR